MCITSKAYENTHFTHIYLFITFTHFYLTTFFKCNIFIMVTTHIFPIVNRITLSHSIRSFVKSAIVFSSSNLLVNVRLFAHRTTGTYEDKTKNKMTNLSFEYLMASRNKIIRIR